MKKNLLQSSIIGGLVMASDNRCTLCGQEGHRASHCPWKRMHMGSAPAFRTQSRVASLAEAVVNTFVGFMLSLMATAAICWAHDIQMTWTNNAIITSYMTALSIGRSYTLRRMWNSEFWKYFSFRRR